MAQIYYHFAPGTNSVLTVEKLLLVFSNGAWGEKQVALCPAAHVFMGVSEHKIGGGIFKSITLTYLFYFNSLQIVKVYMKVKLTVF